MWTRKSLPWNRIPTNKCSKHDGVWKLPFCSHHSKNWVSQELSEAVKSVDFSLLRNRIFTQFQSIASKTINCKEKNDNFIVIESSKHYLNQVIKVNIISKGSNQYHVPLIWCPESNTTLLLWFSCQNAKTKYNNEKMTHKLQLRGIIIFLYFKKLSMSWKTKIGCTISG